MKVSLVNMYACSCMGDLFRSAFLCLGRYSISNTFLMSFVCLFVCLFVCFYLRFMCRDIIDATFRFLSLVMRVSYECIYLCI